MEILKVCVNSHCFSFFLLLLANSLKDRIGFQLSNGNKFSIIVKVWFFYRRGMHSLNSANNLILGFFQHWAKEWPAYINWEPSIRLVRSHHPNLRLNCLPSLLFKLLEAGIPIIFFFYLDNFCHIYAAPLWYSVIPWAAQWYLTDT